MILPDFARGYYLDGDILKKYESESDCAVKKGDLCVGDIVEAAGGFGVVRTASETSGDVFMPNGYGWSVSVGSDVFGNDGDSGVLRRIYAGGGYLPVATNIETIESGNTLKMIDGETVKTKKEIKNAVYMPTPDSVELGSVVAVDEQSYLAFNDGETVKGLSCGSVFVFSTAKEAKRMYDFLQNYIKALQKLIDDFPYKAGDIVKTEYTGSRTFYEVEKIEFPNVRLKDFGVASASMIVAKATREEYDQETENRLYTRLSEKILIRTRELAERETETISRLLSILSAKVRAEGELYKKLQTPDFQIATIKELIQKLDETIKMYQATGNFEDIRRDGAIVYIDTKPLFLKRVIDARFGNDDVSSLVLPEPVEIGAYRLTIDFHEFEYLVERLTGDRFNSIHMHANSGGGLCTGNARASTARALANFDLEQVLETMLEVLETAREGDGYMSLSHFWLDTPEFEKKAVNEGKPIREVYEEIREETKTTV